MYLTNVVGWSKALMYLSQSAGVTTNNDPRRIMAGVIILCSQITPVIILRLSGSFFDRRISVICTHPHEKYRPP